MRGLLEPLREIDGVADVRSVGLAAAVQFEPKVLARHPGVPMAAMLAARGHGVLTRVLRGVALQISPPFTVTEAELETIVGAIETGVREAMRAA